MIPGRPKTNIMRAVAEKPSAKVAPGSSESLASTTPRTKAPARSGNPKTRATAAIPIEAERPRLVWLIQFQALRNSAPRIRTV